MSPHRKHIDRFNARERSKRETVEMIDGRVFYSDDNWTTVYVTSKHGGAPRLLTGSAADRVRFLAIAQSSGGPA